METGRVEVALDLTSRPLRDCAFQLGESAERASKSFVVLAQAASVLCVGVGVSAVLLGLAAVISSCRRPRPAVKE